MPAVAIPPTMDFLSHPIKVDDWPRAGDAAYQELLERIAATIEHGDRETRACAEAMAYVFICEELATSLQAEHGPIAKLMDNLRRSIQSFEEVLG